MNWKLKCAAFHLLGNVPFARTLHSLLQRYVTRRYYLELTPAVLSTYAYHVENFKKSRPGGVALEFGAGRNLITPLLLSAAGAERVYAVDLDRIATLEQVNAIIEQLRRLVPGQWPMLESLDELLPKYRIDYRAPGDARDTGLPEGSVDFIYSTSTLEHIPAEDISDILQECLRIATPQALFSFIIDYHDHYGTADKAIGRFNFYRYSESEWRKYNPSNHYQNRLRHSDHESIFARSKLEAVEVRRLIPPWARPDFERTMVCSAFSHYTQEDLLTSNGYFLMQPAPA